MTLNLQTLMPAALTPGSQKIVTDIDGDGVNELIILDSTIQQLSIVHQFTYGDSYFTLNNIDPTVWPASAQNTTPLWTDTTLRWWTIWATQGVIPNPFTPQWTIGLDDEIMAGDFDGDGIDELFIYNRTTAGWGILKWNSQTKQLQTLYLIQLPQSQPVFPGASQGDITWRISTADQYFVIPKVSSIIPTASGAGFFAFNTQTQALALIIYSTSATRLLQWWQVPAGGSLTGWTLRSDDQFYGANFTAPGTTSVAVLNRSTEYIDLLTWNGSAFTGFQGQHNVGGWSFGSADKVQCADLDGDGVAEILIYNDPGSGNTGYLGVLKWDNGSNQFQAPAVNHGQIDPAPGSAPSDWYIGGTDQYFCLNGTSNNPGPIFAFAPDAVKVAVLNYQNGNFTCKWSVSSLSSSNPAWPVTALDSFYIGSPSSTASPTFFTLSNQGPSSLPVLTLGAVGWNGTNFSIGSSAAIPVLAWSPAFLAAAPQNGFTPFTTGDQPAIYKYISNLFPVPGETTQHPSDDVRASYSNADDRTKFEDYSSALTTVKTSPSQVGPGWLQPVTTWNQSDWQTVVNTIINECEQVDTVYSLYDAIGQLSADLNTFQHDDLTTVKGNIDQTSQSNPPSEVDYWIGQVSVAVLWGLAAGVAIMFPEGMAAEAAGMGAFLSMGASVAGSAFGYNPTQQKSYSEDLVEQQILNTAVQSIVSQSLNLTTYLTDQVKMNICDGLCGSQWAMPTSLPATAQGPFSASDRRVMYEQLIPAYFSITVAGAGVLITQPTYTLNGRDYLLKGNGSIPQSQWQSSPVYADLITTLGVSEEDFFVGDGPWAAIPRNYVFPLVPPD